MRVRNATVVVCFLLLVGSGRLRAADEVGLRPAAQVATRPAPYAFHRPLTSGAIRLYQLTFSRARVVGCPMHPHCSSYGREAFETLNLVHASLATADRLLRCGHDLDRYPLVHVGNRLAFFDPVLPAGSRPRAEEATSLAGLALEAAAPDAQASHPALEAPEAPSRLLAFADRLRAERRFDAALVEYERLLAYFPDSPATAAARRAILECHLGAGRYDMAVASGERLLADETLPEVARAEISLRIGVAELRGGAPAAAQARFEAVADGAPPTSRLAEQGLLLGGIAAAQGRRWREAAAAFGRLDPTSLHAANARQMADVAQRAQRMRRKSPRLASILGVVPGLGYLYSGYRGSAASAFVVNGLFIWATAEAARRHNHGLTATLGVVGSGWYLGNIYGSGVTARRANAAAERELIESLDPGFDY